ncbi:MAG: hypothetical protein H0V23_09680 [Nocardioidaceae bacterium]|nr:hypothetical protein [Nocardioidaceae bacterium]
MPEPLRIFLPFVHEGKTLTRPGLHGETTAEPLDLSALPTPGGARVAAFLERLW